MNTLKTLLSITNDSGILAILNAGKYKSYIGTEWGFKEIVDRFIDEMNNNNIVVWSTGSEDTVDVYFVDEASNRKAEKQFSTTIEITNGRLYLTNYEDLTMAAQYEDEPLPAIHNSGLYIELDNEFYEITIRQLVDGKGIDSPGTINFEVVILNSFQKLPKSIREVFWLTT